MTLKILKFIVLVMVLFFAQESFAQSKSDCDPKACGPGNTKVAEANVITELRKKLQAVINEMAESQQEFDAELIALKLEKGSSDDESILMLSQAANLIRSELINKLPAQDLLPELNGYKPEIGISKQQLIINLRKEVQLLSRQSTKL